MKVQKEKAMESAKGMRQRKHMSTTGFVVFPRTEMAGCRNRFIYTIVLLVADLTARLALPRDVESEIAVPSPATI